VKALVVGSADSAKRLAATLHAREVPASVATPEPPGEERTEVGALAHDLIALELQMSEERPDAVLLADASDRSLAGALAAAKLVIPVAAVGDVDTGETNAQLIDHVADRRLSGDPSELVAWIEAPTLSAP
jgi:hypothetical protein